jgi:hypothetical protein
VLDSSEILRKVTKGGCAEEITDFLGNKQGKFVSFSFWYVPNHHSDILTCFNLKEISLQRI